MKDTQTGRSKASEYWATNLDPQNLERGDEKKAAISVEDEIFFANSPDIIYAKEWLLNPEPQASSPKPRALSPVVDLGAGLGAISFVFARAGARVIAVDSSLGRLRELRRRAEQAKCGHLIFPVVAAAEALPFKDGSIPSLYTKSVLIHTDLPKSTSEIRRILTPQGRAALIEPQPGNPFAWLYRRTLAPKEWQSITRYFDLNTHRFCIDAIGEGKTESFYLFTFLAFVFQFGWPNRKLFLWSLKLLQPIDRAFFRLLPILRRAAWFGVSCILRQGR